MAIHARLNNLIMTTINEFACIDCRADTSCDGLNEYYMVHDHVWALTALDTDDGMLCIGCLEQRIGRELNADDFTAAPVNWLDMFRRSDRLFDRKNKKKTVARRA